jgi:hypothetical protein
MVLLRDKGAPLTVEEMDENLRTLSESLMLSGHQTIKGVKTFDNAQCTKNIDPIGLQGIRSKDLNTFIELSTINVFKLDIIENVRNLYFVNAPLRTSPILNNNDCITGKYALDNLKKGTIISTEYPINPDPSPYNNTWVVISSTKPFVVIKIIKHDGLHTWEE